MKYIYTFLILVGCVAGLAGIGGLIGFVCAKISDVLNALEDKSMKFRKAMCFWKEKLFPVIAAVFFAALTLLVLVLSYFAILKNF